MFSISGPIFSPDPVAHILLIILCVVCIWTDVREQVIYDWATIPAMVLGLGVAWVQGGTDSLISSTVGGLVGFGTFGLLWYMGLIMSGDVFLMGAVGFLIRFPLVMWAMLYASLLGVVVAVVWVAAHGQTGRVISNLKQIIKRIWERNPKEKLKETTPFPFGAAIAGGAIWAAGMAYFPWLGLGLT